MWWTTVMTPWPAGRWLCRFFELVRWGECHHGPPAPPIQQLPLHGAQQVVVLLGETGPPR
jgi:hypothetical protein